MKKVLIICLTILILTLGGCDYPEKDIKLLSEQEIPKVVTKDFILPYGRLGPITYTVSHPEVLVISNLYDVEVIQQDEDVVVIIEARVKEAFRTFEVKVLKKGSPLTFKEEVDLAIEELKASIPNTVRKEIQLPQELRGLSLDYRFASNSNSFMLVKKADKIIWLVPVLTAPAQDFFTSIRVLINNETSEFLPNYYFKVNYQYDDQNLLAQEDVFLSLEIDFKHYQRGTAMLYLFDGESVDFNYQGEEENVNISLRLAADHGDEIVIRDKVLYVGNLSKNKNYGVIVTIDIDGISQDFKVTINKSNN